jgi:hypothetical protein
MAPLSVHVAHVGDGKVLLAEEGVHDCGFSYAGWSEQSCGLSGRNMRENFLETRVLLRAGDESGDIRKGDAHLLCYLTGIRIQILTFRIRTGPCPRGGHYDG